VSTPGPTERPAALRDTAGQDRPLEDRSLWRRHRRLGAGLVVTAGIGIALLVVLSRYSGSARSVDISRVSIATVERGSFVHDIAADGQVVAAVSPTLHAQVPGIVSLKARAGDTVTAGQVLAIIDSPELTARYRQELATLDSLRMDWQRAGLEAERRSLQLKDAYQQAAVDEKTAHRELERSQKAFELGAYTELQALKAQDALEKADFALEQARLSLEQQPKQNRFDVGSRKALLDRQQVVVADLKRQVDDLNVRAPVAGQIGQLQVADRASVAKDAPILTVVDLSALEVEIKIAEGLARDVRPGMSAVLEGDGRRFTGVVTGVSAEVVGGQVTTRVGFGSEKPDHLRQSQRMSVRILLEERNNVLMVDRGAFVDQEGGGFAYVVHGNVADRRPVRLGAASVAKVEILGGLEVGDRIVISGADAFNGAERVILSH
jgi:HlyD family secretion protein